MKVYGPYPNKKSGRKYVVIHYGDGRTKSTAYARYLMEQHLGRELRADETVDHINDDCTDDRLENLQVLTDFANKSKSARRQVKGWVTFVCPACGTTATKEARHVRYNRKRGSAGPFCSKRCANARMERSA